MTKPDSNKHVHFSWKPSNKMLASQRAAKERVLKSDEEFEQAFKILERHPKRVTFFGSARNIEAGEQNRKDAYELAYALTKQGYAIVSGGGEGVMAASNKGAFDAGGVSIGFNIKLPHEQQLNPYTTESYQFQHFFPRKVTMTFYSRAFIFFPGGFGTLDELTEIITLIQTHKMPPLRIILFGHAYWDEFDHFVKKQLLNCGYISPGDENLYSITDSVTEAVYLINNSKNPDENTTQASS